MVIAQRDGEVVHLSERGLRSGEMAERHRPVQPDDRAVGQPDQGVVQQDDLVPIRLAPRNGLRMQSRDRGLDLIRPRRLQRSGSFEKGDPIGDRGMVPPAPILVWQQHHLPRGVKACCRTRHVQRHQGEEAQRLRLVGHECRDEAGEPDGVVRQVAAHGDSRPATEVALVEHQVQH